MIFVATWLASWLIWFIIADKRRWRELFLVSLLAMTLSFFTDAIMHHYRLWEYYDSGLPALLVDSIDDSGIYIVVAYLFIQWLPRSSTRTRMAFYWIGWTTFAIALEGLYVVTGHMRYHQWWTMAHSYVCDWLIFWLLYKFHQIFHLDRLSAS